MFIRRAVTAVALVLMGLGVAVPASAQPIPASHHFTPAPRRGSGRIMSRGSPVRWPLRL